MSDKNESDKTKILVIDDEEDIRFLVNAILTREGYRVTTAKDGMDGLDSFKANPAELVITDVKMPGMDGIEVLRELKKIDPDVVVILLTGHGNMDTAIAALQESAYDFVSKPLENIQILTSTVKTGVQKWRLTQENKRLMNELQVTNDELNKKNAHYFEVLGFVSHELKNAMTILSGYIGLFQDGILGEMQQNQRETMDKIAYNVESINNLIVNYLNLSKVEKGELEVEPVVIDIYNDVLKGVIDIINLQAERGNLNIDLSLGGIPPDVKLSADPALMRIVFLNLLLNAIKYTNEGGKRSFGYEDHGEYIRFNVYNDGAGIPDEDKDRIFNKFVRLKNGAGKKREGSGLGLFTVKKIIQAHNGKIWVESDPDNWINFIFELPKGDLDKKG